MDFLIFFIKTTPAIELFFISILTFVVLFVLIALIVGLKTVIEDENAANPYKVESRPNHSNTSAATSSLSSGCSGSSGIGGGSGGCM